MGPVNGDMRGYAYHVSFTNLAHDSDYKHLSFHWPTSPANNPDESLRIKASRLCPKRGFQDVKGHLSFPIKFSLLTSFA